jgi:VanZ family protein
MKEPREKSRGARPSALWYVTPAALYVAYIFVMGTAENAEPPMDVSDKTAHFAAFGLMVPFLTRALRYFLPAAPRVRLVLAAAALSSLAGALLEFWQAFLPYRSAELLDWVADTIGAVFAGCLTALAWRLARAARDAETSGSGA